jgi:D-lactate dehydrogenase
MDFTIKDLVGFDLKRKTIGIIGGGRIGMNVAKIAHGFGMNVLVYDKFRNNFYTDILDFKYVDELDEIYKCSDIISLHLPFTPKTRHTIDKSAVKKMKKGVVLLNTARGALVDTDALIYGLEKGIIGYAGLDVLEEEEYITHPHSFGNKHNPTPSLITKNRAIIAHPRVLFTPHNAFNTKEALERIESVTIENIKSHLRGQTINQVKP